MGMPAHGTSSQQTNLEDLGWTSRWTDKMPSKEVGECRFGGAGVTRDELLQIHPYYAPELVARAGCFVYWGNRNLR